VRRTWGRKPESRLEGDGVARRARRIEGPPAKTQWGTVGNPLRTTAACRVERLPACSFGLITGSGVKPRLTSADVGIGISGWVLGYAMIEKAPPLILAETDDRSESEGKRSGQVVFFWLVGLGHKQASELAATQTSLKTQGSRPPPPTST